MAVHEVCFQRFPLCLHGQLFPYTVHSVSVWVQYLEHNIDLFSQWVGVDQGQLQGNCVGVEEGAGLHTQTDFILLMLYMMLFCL